MDIIKLKKHPYKKIRQVWSINPKTRYKPEKPLYNRGQEKVKLRKEMNE